MMMIRSETIIWSIACEFCECVFYCIFEYYCIVCLLHAFCVSLPPSSACNLCMALNGLLCADMPLRTYTLTCEFLVHNEINTLCFRKNVSLLL